MGGCLGSPRRRQERAEYATAFLPTGQIVLEPPPALLLQEFLHALRHGRLSAVKDCIAKSHGTLPFVDLTNPHQAQHSMLLPFATALVTACWLGHHDVVEFLMALEPRPPRSLVRQDFGLACQMVKETKYIFIMVDHFGSIIVNDDNDDHDYSSAAIDTATSIVTYRPMSPLHQAFLRRDLTLIQYLLHHGANLSSQALSNGTTPLHCLAQAVTLNSKDDDDNNTAVAAILDWILRQPEHAPCILLENRFGKTALQSILFSTSQFQVIRTCIIWLCQRR